MMCCLARSCGERGGRDRGAAREGRPSVGRARGQETRAERESKQKEVRYLDIHEDDPLDEAQFAAWVKQASQLPGERM